MGLLKGIVSIVGFLILAVIGLGAFLYFTDYEVQGTITEKGQDADGAYVIIHPQLIPRDVRQPLDDNAAPFVCEGYTVTYRIQTGSYTVRDTQGRLVYDSHDGLTNLYSPTRCALLGT